LGRLMYNSCEGESFDCKSRHCRGPQTGLGEGDFTTWSIEKDDELIAVSGSYGYSGSSGFTHRRGVELHSPLLNGTKCVNSHTAGEIENPDLRKFVYNFYEAWKK